MEFNEEQVKFLREAVKFYIHDGMMDFDCKPDILTALELGITPKDCRAYEEDMIRAMDNHMEYVSAVR